MAFIGVRISWLIRDKNSVLALLAFSAEFLASSNSFIILRSGFSIVKYIKKVINPIKYVNKSNSGLIRCIITTIVPNIRSPYKG